MQNLALGTRVAVAIRLLAESRSSRDTRASRRRRSISQEFFPSLFLYFLDSCALRCLSAGIIGTIIAAEGGYIYDIPDYSFFLSLFFFAFGIDLEVKMLHRRRVSSSFDDPLAQSSK